MKPCKGKENGGCPTFAKFLRQQRKEVDRM